LHQIGDETGFVGTQRGIACSNKAEHSVARKRVKERGGDRARRNRGANLRGIEVGQKSQTVATKKLNFRK